MARPPYAVSHVFFDVDGTLVDYRASMRAGLEASAAYISERLGRLVSPAALLEVRARVIRAHPTFDAAAVRDESFRQAFRERGLDDPSAVAEAARHFVDARDAALAPFEDVVEAVSTLRDRGFVLVAATNGDAALMRTPVFDLLHGTWDAGEAGASKPHPAFYERALARFEAQPGAALMVGDRLDNDVEPALSVGMHAVLLDREGKVNPANLECEVIRSLRDLPSLVGFAT